MGRGSTTRTSSSTRGSSRSSSPIPTSEFDPAYPPNLKRSLARNDVELAALDKLHVALRILKEAICGEFGEDVLVQCVVDEKRRIVGGGKEDDEEVETAEAAADADDGEDQSTEDEKAVKDDPKSSKRRLTQLTNAFLLRMKLRRRLLNRLARRLHRIAHIMDNSSHNKISAPLPPLYGDIMRRFISEESYKSGVAQKALGNLENVELIREGNVVEFQERERRRREVRGELEGLRRRRMLEGVVGGGGEKKKEGGESEEVKEDKLEVESEGKEEVANDKENEREDDKESEPSEAMDEDKSNSMDVDEKINEDVASKEEEQDALPNKSKVDLLLKGDEEDKPLLDQLAEYEPGYDKLYSIGPLPPLPPVSSPASSAEPAKETETPTEGDKPEAKAATSPAASPTKHVQETASPDKNSTVVVHTTEKQVIKVTKPIATTIDDHEVNEEGEFLLSKDGATTSQSSSSSSRVPFYIYGAAPTRILQPKERSVEWKRWTKELCERIPDQVTFDELAGVGGGGMMMGRVFDLEGRLLKKRKRDVGGEEEEEEELEKKKKELLDDGGAENRGKGKVLRKKCSPEKADKPGNEDVAMSEDAAEKEEAKTAKDTTDEKGADSKKKKESSEKKAAKDLPTKPTKSFSLQPVPSFYYQDLKRIKILQNDMVNSRRVLRTREKVLWAQEHYQKAYKHSVDLQQAKASAMSEYNRLVQRHKKEVEDIASSAKRQLAAAKRHWETRQGQLQEVTQNLGEETALMRDVSNDLLQDMKDRVCIRTAEELEGSGLGTFRLRETALKARSEGDEHRNVSATVLGLMVDSVARRHDDMLQNHPQFVPPEVSSPSNTIMNPQTGETVSHYYARKMKHVKMKIAQLDAAFVDAEKKRSDAWAALSKAKGGGGGGGGQSSSSSGGASKTKPRGRKSTGSTTGTGTVRMMAAPTRGVSAANIVPSTPVSRQSYPIQMQMQAQQQQQPRPAHRNVPGYVPASYYQQGQQRTTAAYAGTTTAAATTASQQMQAARMMQQAAAQVQVFQQARQQIAHIQTAQSLLAQQHQQQQQQQQRQLQLQQQVQVLPGGGGGGAQFHPVQNIQNIVLQRSVVQPGAGFTTPSAAGTGIPPSAPAAHSIVASNAANNVAAVAAALAPANQEAGAGDAKKPSSLAKYGYGDKYSQTNVNARKNPDGTVVPASTPKLLPNGQYARPAGRQRKGMDWDAERGIWFPAQEGQGGPAGGNGG